jgi:hypothetical protein
MENDKATDMFMKLMEEIHQNTSALKDMLANHEARITVLERSDENKSGKWKNELLLLLAKATVIGLVAIGSLTGASSLIQKVLRVEVPITQSAK